MKNLGRPFWRLYASSATSNLADGIGRVALPLLAASYTRNPLLISGLTSLAFLPWLLFALPSGALVDRTDRKRAMAAANALRAAATVTLGVLVFTGLANIGVLYVVAFALGLAETVYDSASRAILPQVVAADRLDDANGLLTIEEMSGQTFVGAPLGSALFAVTLALPFVVNASGFAFAALLILTLRGSFRPARDVARTTIRGDVVEGVRWLASHRFLRGLTLVSAATALIQSMTNGIIVLYALETLHLPAGDFGFLLVGAGVGAVAGGVSTPALARRYGRAPVLVIGEAVSALAMIALGLTTNGYVAGTLYGVAAAGVMTWNVLTMSLRQALIPHRLFGRVQGAYRTLVYGAIPLGSLAGGVLAHVFGLQPVFVIAGIGLLAMAGVLGLLVRAHPAELAAEAVAADELGGGGGVLPPEEVPCPVERV